MREVRRDIEREAVPRHPLLHVNPDAGDLPAACPHARESRTPLRRDIQDRERVDQRLLERAQIPVQILPVGAQVEDGIADQLARAMERHVAAALDFEHVDALSLQQVLGVRIPPQCDDRGMLEQ